MSTVVPCAARDACAPLKFSSLAVALLLILSGFLTTGPARAQNTAYGFSSGNKVTLTDAMDVLNNRGAFTIELWAKFDNTSGIINLVSFEPNDASNASVGGLVLNNGVLSTDIRTGWSGGLTSSNPAGIGTGSWYHIAWVFDGGTHRYYVNGASVGSSADGGGAISTPTDYATSNPKANDIVLGTNSHGAIANFAGDIDELRVWGTARTQSEIQNNRSTELSGNEPGLVGYWTLNETSGATANDSQTNTATHDGNSSGVTLGVNGAFTTASSNADLSNLTLSDGALTPVFAAGTTTYTSTVPASVSEVTVTPTLADANASVTVEGVSVTSGAASDPISLSYGANTITTEVTAQDGVTTKTYTVDVTRDSPDSDGDLTAAGGVSEPVAIGTTNDTSGEAVDVFDVTLSDGGTSDGLPMTVSEIVLNVSGTSTDVERGQVTWRLNGNDASNVTGTYDAGADVVTFSSLSISVADGGSETYTVNAYYNDNTGLTEDHTYVLSIDGDTDLTVGASGTQMGATPAVTNGTGSPIDVTATGLAFTTQPAGATSGSALSTQPVVAAQDAFGNTDVDFSETVTLTESSAGSLSGDTDVAAVSGVATFTDVAYTASADQESFTLTANDEDGTGTDLATEDANAVTADVVATQLEFSTEPSPTTVARDDETSFSTVPVVRAVDANGMVDTGYSTDIQLAEVNGSGSATLSVTNDQDGSANTATLTPSSGAATFTDLAIAYTPSEAGAETFNLQASSGGLTTANSTQLTANQEPAFDDGASTSLAVNEDDGATSVNGLLGVTDADSGQTLTWSVASSPSKGALNGFSTNETSDGGSVTPSGLTYTPNADATGADSFDIQISDGLDTATITVSVTINARPTVTIASGESSPTNTSPFDVTVAFSESVSGFASDDVAVGNGNVSGVSGTGDTYTVSITPTSDGTVTVDVLAGSATDGSGASNEAATQFTIEYDGSAPSEPSTPDLAGASDTGGSSTDDITSDTTPTLTGIAEANSTVGLTSDQDGSLGTTTADSNGDWSFTPGNALTEATHSLTATATDAAGNTSGASASLSVTVDTTDPAAPSIPDLLAGSDTGSSSTDDVTSDTTPTLTGTAEANATVTVTSDQDGTVGTTTADGNGDWSFTPGSALTEATHSLTVTATDGAGNRATSAALSVVLDTTQPVLASTSPSDDATDVQHDDNLVLTFSETVGTGSGSDTAVDIYRASDDGLHASVDITAATVNANTVTVALSNSFTPTESYYVHVGAEALIDEAGNSFAGLQDKTTFNFTVANNGPIASDDAASTDEDNSVVIDVLANDSDEDSNLNAASVTVISAPSSGSTGVNASTGAITYTPNADFNGQDTFAYTVEDGQGATSSAATVTVTVSAVPDVTVTDGSSYTAPAPTVGENDNPIGRALLSADESGGVVTDVAIALDGITQGVASIELWSSADATFEAGSDTELATKSQDPSSDAPSSVTFSGLSVSVSTSATYLFLVVDLTSEAGGDLQARVAQKSDLVLSTGKLTNPSGDFPAPLSSASASLPVELVGFTAVQKKAAVALRWMTASETNNTGFYVEHAAPTGPDSAWADLGFVEGAGTTHERTAYRFETDELAVGTHRFRLKQVDVDGTVAYSEEITTEVKLAGTYKLVTYPNPFTQRATIELAVQEEQDVRVRVYDVIGRHVATLYDSRVPSHETKHLALDAGQYRLGSGLYFIRIVGEHFAGTRRITIVR